MTTTTTGIATEFITFSRTSNATLTDSDGRIKWAPHNLLLASEQFDASQWLKTNGTSTTPAVTANASAAPNGTTTADRVDFGAIDAAADYSVMYQTFTAVDTSYTAGVWVKAFAAGDVGKNVWLYLFDTANRGQITITLTANWQFVSTTATLTSGTRSWYISTLGSDFGGTNQAATSVLVWGAHVYRSDLGGMKSNTSAYPMYNPTTPKNLVGYTEDFSNAVWVKTNILAFGSGSVANAIIAPNGLQTADKIVSSTATGNHRVNGSSASGAISSIVSGTNYVFSFYAKAAEYSKVQIADAVYSVYSARFDLTGSGSVIASSGCTAAITAVGNGWYRCSAVYTSGGTVSYAHISPYPDTGASFSVDGASYTGDGVSGVYIWGAQLSDSASLDAYVPNNGPAPTAAAYYGPRLDADPVTLSQRGLLVEEARTNLALQSAEFDVGWTLLNLLAFGSGSVANAISAPSGAVTADFIVPDTTSGQHGLYRTVTTVSGTAYTQSVYAKAGGYNWLYMTEANNVTAQASFDISTGVLGTVSGTGSPSATITPVGNGWYRCTLTFTPSSTASNIQIRANSANGGANFVGNGTSGIYIWGAQLELGSFATSYIPTGAAAATRAADVASVSTSQFPYSATEGTLVISADSYDVGSSAGLIASLSAGLTSNSVLVGLYLNKTSLSATAGGVAQAFLQPSGTVSANTVFKAGGAFATNSFIASSNGTLSTEDTSGSLPTGVTTLGIGIISSSIPINGHIRQITYLPRRITNAELQTRTA